KARASLEKGLDAFDRRYGLNRGRKVTDAQADKLLEQLKVGVNRPIVEGVVAEVDEARQEMVIDLGKSKGIASLKDNPRYAKAGDFNRALAARRLPGSAFKPIVYAAALAAKVITPATLINDAPETYARWKPENYDGKYRGPIRTRQAVADSVNLVAIKVLEM